MVGDRAAAAYQLFGDQRCRSDRSANLLRPLQRSSDKLQPRQLEVAAQQTVAKRSEGPVAGFGCRGGRFCLVSRARSSRACRLELVEGFETVGEEG